jgi:hypothetical protein
VPTEPDKPIDRVTLVAIKGKAQRVLNSPMVNDEPMKLSPEAFTLFKMERLLGKAYKVARMVPRNVRVMMKRGGLLGRLYKPLPEAIGQRK